MKASVIIPVYNTDKYLAECLDSVLCQNMKDMEIICVDDASNDSSPIILAEYASKDPRVRIISLPENHGQAFARNRGLEIASGEYVYFMDADDMLSIPEAMDILYTEAVKYSTDCLLFDASKKFETPELGKRYKLLRVAIQNKYPLIYTGKDAFSLLENNNDYIPMVWLQFWHRAFLRENGITFNEATSPHEDELFTIQAMLTCHRIKHIAANLYIYRCRAGSSMNEGHNKKRWRAMGLCYLETIKFLEKIGFKAEDLDALTRHLNRIRGYFRDSSVALTCRGISIPDLIKESFPLRDQLVLRNVLQDNAIYPWHMLNSEEREKISKYKHVIIYGAGKIGKEVAHLLDLYGIDEYIFAVTSVEPEKRYIGGKEVVPLSSLCGLATDSIVLLATVEGYHESMKKEMERLGFTEYINMYI